MGRSGTTLIEKLLTNHHEVDILSQPFPLLFISLKTLFFESIGIKKYYVLNDDIHDRNYLQNDFDSFLKNLNINKDFLVKLFEKMQQYSGQYTKIETLNINEKNLSNLSGIYEELLNSFNLKDKQLIGSKETMCEEFIPYLSDNNFNSIIILRDPRDVVASANYPKGDKHFGDKKPILSFKKASTTTSLAAFNIHGIFPPFSIAEYARLKFLKVSKLAFSKVNSG